MQKKKKKKNPTVKVWCPYCVPFLRYGGKFTAEKVHSKAFGPSL